MVILFSLARAGPASGSFPPIGSMPLSINALTTRDAEAKGLLARGAANDEITIRPRGREALEIFLANVFLYQAACAGEAYQVATSAAAAGAGRLIRPLRPCAPA